MVAASAVHFQTESVTGYGSRPLSWAGLDVFVGVPFQTLEADWRALEAHGTASAFQGWQYTATWLRTASAAAGESPVFVVGCGNGEARLILPMAVVRRSGVNVLQWLGQMHMNYGMGLLHPETFAEISYGDVDELLLEIGRRAGAAVVHLDRQPATWAGRANPFAHSPCSIVTANDTYLVALETDYKAQYKRLYPNRALQVFKRRQRRLEELGTVSFAAPAGDAERRAAIDWFVRSKREQLVESGRRSPFDEPGIHAFYDALAEDTATFSIDQITVSGERAAIGMTLFGGGIAYGLNTSHDHRFSRGSPGTLLQHRIIEAVHARGARAYDFGPGFLPYKAEWKPQVVPLVATSHLVRPIGLHAHAALVFSVLAKARIKRSPTLSAWALGISRMFG